MKEIIKTEDIETLTMEVKVREQQRGWDICPHAYSGCEGARIKEIFDLLCVDPDNGERPTCLDLILDGGNLK